MNKAAIKSFAVWAREKLIADIIYKASILGVTENGIAKPLPQSTKDLQFFDIGTKNFSEVQGIAIKQREALVNTIKSREASFKTYKEAFDSVVEEVAYTWFNRLIAIRFMEVNGYLPSGVRVLSSEIKAKNEPDFVTTPFDTDLEFTPGEQDLVIKLKEESKLDELFRMLFIRQCNKLHEVLPDLFESTEDYSELLLTISFTDTDGIVYHLVHDIDEDDFNVEKEGQVEIIGWLYQYYNIEPKAAVFARESGSKIKKAEIPAATQLFTPDWIVRYMVENSLGRLWLEGHPDFDKSKWIYYLDEAEQEDSVKQQLDALREKRKNLKPEEIKFIDPCMGSGHILVYAFDVLMQIYESSGYTARDAARSILKNNLFGLDIDKRAYQLAYFAVMMKARQYNRRILAEGITPNLCYVCSSFAVPMGELNRLGDSKALAIQIIDDFKYADEYGSMLKVSYRQDELDCLEAKLRELKEMPPALDFFEQADFNTLISCLDMILPEARFLSQKYDAVVTNPPYMGASGMDKNLSDFVKQYYPDSKSDLSTCFMEKCESLCLNNAYYAMINIPVWMFLSSYEKLRYKLLLNDEIINMIHPGRGIFGSDFGTTAFVIRKGHIPNYQGSYRRLFDAQGEVKSIEEREKAFLAKKGCYTADQSNFSKIPGSPVAYWVSEKIFNTFSCENLQSICSQKTRISTGNNDLFMRVWYEVSSRKLMYPNKWVPCPKGGSYRKWYGNIEIVLNWENDGEQLNSFPRAMLGDKNYFLKPGLTWTVISSAKTGFRIVPAGCICDHKGPLIYTDNPDSLPKILGLLNSKFSDELLKITAPTIGFEWGAIAKTPWSSNTTFDSSILQVVNGNIKISKTDWDSFENSWDFTRHPLIRPVTTLADAYAEWEAECNDRFNQLKANEEELNRIFIDIYGLQDELTPEVEDKDITVRKADLQREIKSLISYAVGCMLGRYSLDVEGLAYAGGEWDSSKYTTFIPDADNCIPITDEAYFEDDIVGRFVEFIRVVYGEKTLEENLLFIANALGNKGTTSRDVIRNYFLNDFMADHIKVYQKRPIYWLFDSGKQNGFKALCYMHRWNADTTGNMRVEYLHRMQRVYEKEIERMQDTIDNSNDSKEVSSANKRKEKLQKQLKETKEFDSKVAHLALARIEIDLDDGVKVNYEKVQTAPDGKKAQVLVKL